METGKVRETPLATFGKIITKTALLYVGSSNGSYPFYTIPQKKREVEFMAVGSSVVLLYGSGR